MFPPPSKTVPKGFTPITEAQRAVRPEKRPATQAVAKKPKDRGPKWWETIFKDENFKRLVWYEESPEPMRFLRPVSSKDDVPGKDAPEKDEPSKQANFNKKSEPNKKKPKPSREEMVATMVNPGATGEAFYKARPLSEYADMITLQDKLESIKDFILQTALDHKRFEIDFVCSNVFNAIISLVFVRLEASKDPVVGRALVSFLQQPDVFNTATIAVENLLTNVQTHQHVFKMPGLVSALTVPLAARSDDDSNGDAARRAIDVLLRLSTDPEVAQSLAEDSELMTAIAAQLKSRFRLFVVFTSFFSD